jgi:hypothetical protein
MALRVPGGSERTGEGTDLSPRQAERTMGGTAELKNKFMPDRIRVPPCLGVINLYCASYRHKVGPLCTFARVRWGGGE